MVSIALNVLDELYLHLDREDEPWTVQLEAEMEGAVDGERLAQAVVDGARAHPIARARLRAVRGTDVRYHWEIAEALDAAPLEEVDCAGPAEVAAARERLMSASPTLDQAPPFAMTLAHAADGDTIMLSLNHAAGDGISAVRLMASFLRAYRGDPDPVPSICPLEVRDIGALVNSRSLGARLARGRTLVKQTTRMATSPARIAPHGAVDRPGYGFELLHLSSGDLATVLGHRAGGATVNDVLLAALAVTVRRWNDSHDVGEGGLALTMPVNLRPAEWRNDVVGNFASYVSVPFSDEEQARLPAAVAAAASRTRQIKDEGAAGLVVDLLELPTATLPTAVKRRFQDLITLTGSRLLDTAMLSNLGRLEAVPELGGRAGRVRRVWFSPPGRMPLGASLGAATHRDEMFLCLRYRHALFDASAAAAFGALLRDVLTADEQRGEGR